MITCNFVETYII